MRSSPHEVQVFTGSAGRPTYRRDMMSPSRQDAIAALYRVMPGVEFLTEEQYAGDLAAMGLKHIPPSYAWAKRVFGNSRIMPWEANFWINVPGRRDGYGSMREDRDTLLKERVYGYLDGTYKYEWYEEKDPGIDFKNLIPLQLDGEYDHWLAWDLSRISADGEPFIHSFDLGMPRIEPGYPNIYALYEERAERDGHPADFERDEEGRILLGPM